MSYGRGGDMSALFISSARSGGSCLHFIVLLLACAWSLNAAAQGGPAVVLNTPENRRLLLERLRSAPLHVSEVLLRRGIKFETDGRQWPRLIEKLQADKSNVTIVVYGGSVSVGYRLCNTSYPEEFTSWLAKVFPNVQFTLVNLARRATAATFAALCLVQDQPPNADLIIVEYSANGYGGQCQCFTAPQNAGYETLLRKAIMRAPRAALMAFASFLFEDGKGQPAHWYDTGEDQHAVIARRYGIPMTSVRDAFFDAFSREEGLHGVRRKDVLVDIVHPGEHGSRVFAALLALAFRHQVTRTLLHTHALALESMSSTAMPPPINEDAAQEAWATFCAEGLGLQRHVESIQGWDWVDEGSNACAGCHKYGYAANDVGASLTLKVNSDIRKPEAQSKASRVQLALSYLRSGSNVGHALVECIRGCQCNTTKIDAKNPRPTSELFTFRMPITPHTDCRVRITVANTTSTSGHKFRLSSLAVHLEVKGPDRDNMGEG